MIRRRLREETSQQHALLEQRMLAGGLLGDDLARSSYRALLARFHGFYAPFESLLANATDWESLGPVGPYRARTPRLASDLLALGVADDALERLPRCADLPILSGLPRALGARYVVEGAALGGQIITRHVRRTLNLDVETGCAFFTGDGEEVGRHWRAFLGLLESRLLALDDQSAAVAAAAETFAAFARWLDQGGHA